MTALLRAITPRSWLLISALVLVLFIAGQCAVDARRDAAQAVRKAEVGQTMAEGRTAAASDASAIRDRADERTDQINTTTQEATDAIRNAPDDASASAAALRGLCQLYPDRDPRCRVQ